MKWVKQLFSRSRLYGDLSEEIQSHVDEKSRNSHRIRDLRTTFEGMTALVEGITGLRRHLHDDLSHEIQDHAQEEIHNCRIPSHSGPKGLPRLRRFSGNRFKQTI
jgi:hypothetical protein